MIKKKTEPSFKDMLDIAADHISGYRDALIAKGVPEDVAENISLRFYMNNDNDEEWKGGKTKFVKMFDKECKYLLKNKVIDLREFGFLSFLALNFTSFEDNMLRDKDGKACTQKDIIDEVGLAKSTVSGIMKKLIFKGLVDEYQHEEVLNGKMYELNPMLFYRGSRMDKRQKEIMKDIKDSVWENWKHIINEGEIKLDKEYTQEEINELLKDDILETSITIAEHEDEMLAERIDRRIREEASAK